MAENGVYDVVGAFQNIEDILITSMMQNMRKHIGDENEEGINWTQWQAEMLQGLEQYKLENSGQLKGYYSTINKKIEDAIRLANTTGQSEAEIEILKNIQEGLIPKRRGRGVDGAFFAINADKLNALIKSTTEDFEKAEYAILRRTEDVYRQTIFNAQMYYNSGAGTLDKAIDMATKSFLSSGINCIQYANGARVNIASYAEMALRTANKRANLMGQATKRDQYGEHLVKITVHNSACPKCVEWQGKVYVDNVYGSGTAKESTETGYRLLSAAIDGGMFHPNCKNGLSTYYEGISEPPKATTPEQEKEMNRRYELEQQQRYCERNIRKYKRLASGSLNAEDAAKYSKKETEWKQKYKDLIGSNKDVLREDPSRLKLYGVGQIDKGTLKKPTKANTSVTKTSGANTWSNYKHTDTEFKTKKDIVTHIKNRYGIAFSDSKKAPIDKDLFANCANWMDKFNDCFKNFSDKNPIKLPKIKVAANSSMNGAVGYYQYYTYSHEPIELALNSAYHGNANYFQNYVNETIKSKWTVANATTHKTFVHEYGHHVSNCMCAMYGDNWEKKFIDECITDFKSVTPEYKHNTYIGLSDYLSRYGSTKQCECFAEAFAEYFGGENPRIFAKIFGEKLEKLLMGVK